MKKRSSHGRKHTPADNGASKTTGGKGREVEAKVPRCIQSNSGWFMRIKKALLALCIVYSSVPFVLRLFPGILAHMVYSHTFRVPFFVDLSRPADLSLNHTVNFYLTPEEGVTVGVWHTVPDSRWKEAQGKDLAWYQESLKDGAPVIIYLHGNGGTRSMKNRSHIN
ncbi:hypothetical protein MATL_G00188710 [Megalops atlanticus]|uniref:Uncharacterized protein n=1 Tax=Megalops atlanticus TaxID=7932 RepID=A0A9D3SZ99_MEGAT|nr:hypothetical protein MATL_G00188710 [Megalops atlanticus]